MILNERKHKAGAGIMHSPIGTENRVSQLCGKALRHSPLGKVKEAKGGTSHFRPFRALPNAEASKYLQRVNIGNHLKSPSSQFFHILFPTRYIVCLQLTFWFPLFVNVLRPNKQVASKLHFAHSRKLFHQRQHGERIHSLYCGHFEVLFSYRATGTVRYSS
jgi:hypothetical protein